MKKLTLEDLKTKGLIAYQHIAGSKLFGLDTPESDTDIHGVYLAPTEILLGLSDNYQEIIQDEKNDVVFHELKKFIDLLCKSNPTMLEMLYVPEDKIIGEVHPAIREIINNRDLFLTKQCFKPFVGYAIEQIKKCRSLNKLCNIEKIERKRAIDFCYTYFNQGSTKILNWLEYRGLKQEFCGLAKIPNMHENYGVYYDFKSHLNSFANKESEEFNLFMDFYWDHVGEPHFTDNEEIEEHIRNREDVKYYGLFSDLEKAQQVCLSSISKNTKPICHMTFNESGFSAHCQKYREVKMWEKNRNEHRFIAAKKNNYDVKNMSHVFRLLEMGIEIARGDGFNVVRTHDNQFLRDIKLGKFEYDDLIILAEEKKNTMEELIKTCTLPETIDRSKVNDLLVSVRLEQLKHKL